MTYFNFNHKQFTCYYSLIGFNCPWVDKPSPQEWLTPHGQDQHRQNGCENVPLGILDLIMTLGGLWFLVKVCCFVIDIIPSSEFSSIVLVYFYCFLKYIPFN